jgi:hypothetical protein
MFLSAESANWLAISIPPSWHFFQMVAKAHSLSITSAENGGGRAVFFCVCRFSEIAVLVVV